MQDTNKWGLTRVNINKCTYTWSISNFSYLRKKIGEELESPSFSIGSREETKWCLRLYLQGINDNHKDHLSVYLHRKSGAEYKIDGQYAISILNEKREKFVEEVEECEYNKNYSSWGFPGFVRSELVRERSNNLLTNDTLTLCCEFAIVVGIVGVSSETIGKAIDRPSDSSRSALKDLGKLFLSERFSDVKLVTECGRELPAHKAILAARSPAFLAMFEHDMLEKSLNVVRIVDVEHEVLREMLRFVYVARVEGLESLASGLLVAADKYGIEGLRELCEEVLSEKMSVENVVETLVLADLHSMADLKARAINFIKAHIKEVIDSEVGFKSVRRMDVLLDVIRALVM